MCKAQLLCILSTTAFEPAFEPVKLCAFFIPGLPSSPKKLPPFLPPCLFTLPSCQNLFLPISASVFVGVCRSLPPLSSHHHIFSALHNASEVKLSKKALRARARGDISRFFPRIDRIFPGEALNPFFGAQDEGFSEFRSR